MTPLDGLSFVLAWGTWAIGIFSILLWVGGALSLFDGSMKAATKAVIFLYLVLLIVVGIPITMELAGFNGARVSFSNAIGYMQFYQFLGFGAMACLAIAFCIIIYFGQPKGLYLDASDNVLDAIITKFIFFAGTTTFVAYLFSVTGLNMLVGMFVGGAAGAAAAGYLPNQIQNDPSPPPSGTIASGDIIAPQRSTPPAARDVPQRPLQSGFDVPPQQ